MKKKKNNLTFSIQQNSFKDDGKGVISFPSGMTITDDKEQRNGTRYDIKTMDLSEYAGILTADHSWSIQEIIGKTSGVRKVGNKRVTIDSIKFAIEESALALFAYNMIKGGYLTDFSIETIGPWADEDGVYHDAKLIGLSAVVTGNNKSAEINQIAVNSIEQAQKEGLDTSLVENKFMCYDSSQTDETTINTNSEEDQMKFVTIKNGRNFAVVVKYKNASGDEVEKTLLAGETVDVSEDQKNAIESQISNAVDTEKQNNALATIVKEAVAPLMQKVEALEKQAFDKSAIEPEFKKDKSDTVPTNNGASELAKMSYKERHAVQINAIYDMAKGHSKDAANKLVSVNEFHFEELKKAKIITNAVTMSDFGNFVISPELLTDIEGYRSDFARLLAATSWQETLSLQMAWLERSGDINMQSVDMCEDGDNGNLKPISDYSASIKTANLEELAAVTPVCNAATRFLAADLLGDVAAGYRNDYDRKRAQLVIARLQQAVDLTNREYPYRRTTAITSLQSWVEMMSVMQEEIMNGVFIFNQQTYGELLGQAIGAGVNGPLSTLFTTGDQPLVLGRPYIVVPNELMPSLNTGGTRSFTVNGTTVTITAGVFYAELSKFKGRTSGGLRYDLSTEAAYEENGTVKSAFQRDELVARGYFFRGGAFTDPDRVTAMQAAGIS